MEISLASATRARQTVGHAFRGGSRARAHFQLISTAGQTFDHFVREIGKMTAFEEGLGAHEFPDFATTQWSLVRAAGQRSSSESEAALQRLCGAYWLPLHSYVRRRVPALR